MPTTTRSRNLSGDPHDHSFGVAEAKSEAKGEMSEESFKFLRPMVQLKPRMTPLAPILKPRMTPLAPIREGTSEKGSAKPVNPLATPLSSRKSAEKDCPGGASPSSSARASGSTAPLSSAKSSADSTTDRHADRDAASPVSSRASLARDSAVAAATIMATAVSAFCSQSIASASRASARWSLAAMKAAREERERLAEAELLEQEERLKPCPAWERARFILDEEVARIELLIDASPLDHAYETDVVLPHLGKLKTYYARQEQRQQAAAQAQRLVRRSGSVTASARSSLWGVAGPALTAGLEGLNVPEAGLVVWERIALFHKKHGHFPLELFEEMDRHTYRDVRGIGDHLIGRASSNLRTIGLAGALPAVAKEVVMLAIASELVLPAVAKELLNPDADAKEMGGSAEGSAGCAKPADLFALGAANDAAPAKLPAEPVVAKPSAVKRSSSGTIIPTPARGHEGAVFEARAPKVGQNSRPRKIGDTAVGAAVTLRPHGKEGGRKGDGKSDGKDAKKRAPRSYSADLAGLSPAPKRSSSLGASVGVSLDCLQPDMRRGPSVDRPPTERYLAKGADATKRRSAGAGPSTPKAAWTPKAANGGLPPSVVPAGLLPGNEDKQRRSSVASALGDMLKPAKGAPKRKSSIAMAAAEFKEFKKDYFAFVTNGHKPARHRVVALSRDDHDLWNEELLRAFRTRQSRASHAHRSASAKKHAADKAPLARRAVPSPDGGDGWPSEGSLSELQRRKEVHRSVALAALEESLLDDEDDDGRDPRDLMRLAATLIGQRQFEAALPCAMRGAQRFERRQGPNKADTIAALTVAAKLLRRLGHSERAIDAFTKLHGQQEALLGPDHPEVAATCSALGQLLSDKSSPAFSPDLALIWLFAALRIRELHLKASEEGEPEPEPESVDKPSAAKAGGKEVAACALSLHHLGVVHSDLLRYDDAIGFFARALKLRRALGDDAQRDTASTLNNMAAVLHQMGRNEQCLKVYGKSLEIKQLLLSKDHPSIADTLFNMGALNMELNRPKEAIEYFSAALSISTRKLGKRHPLTLDLHGQIKAAEEQVIAPACKAEAEAKAAAKAEADVVAVAAAAARKSDGLAAETAAAATAAATAAAADMARSASIALSSRLRHDSIVQTGDGPSDDLWGCPSCMCDNPAHLACCEACGCQRPAAEASPEDLEPPAVGLGVQLNGVPKVGTGAKVIDSGGTAAEAQAAMATTMKNIMAKI